MIVAGAIVARNPYLTFPQKVSRRLDMLSRTSLINYSHLQLVQARMWAQGLTVGVLIGSGVVAGMSSDGEKHELEEDHSWKEILGEFERIDRGLFMPTLRGDGIEDEQEKEQARSKSIQKPTN